MGQLTLSLIKIMLQVLDRNTLRSCIVKLLKAFKILSPYNKLPANCAFDFLHDIATDKRNTQIVILDNQAMFDECLKMLNVIKFVIIQNDFCFKEYYTQELEDFTKYIACKYLSLDKRQPVNFMLLNKCMVILSFKVRQETMLFKQKFKNNTMVIKRLLEILNVSSMEHEVVERHILKTVNWAVCVETPLDKFLLLHGHVKKHLKCSDMKLRHKKCVRLLNSYYRCTADDAVYIYHSPFLVAVGMLLIAFSDVGNVLFQSKTWKDIKESNRDVLEEICRRLTSNEIKHYSWK